MIFSNNNFVGRITVTAGVTAAVQIILLILMFSISINPYGPMSDYVYTITPILMIPLMFAFRYIYQGQHYKGSQWAQAIGIFGAAIACLNQILFISKIIDLKQSMVGSYIGNGLIGITILIFGIFSLTNPEMPKGLAILGIVLGAGLTFGLILGTFYLDDIYAISTGMLTSGNPKPIIYPVMMTAAITQLGLPTWLLILGRRILSGSITW